MFLILKPSLQREACTGFYRLCLGTSAEGHSGYQFVIPLLNSLLTFLSVAQDMKPPRPDVSYFYLENCFCTDWLG